MMMRTTVFMRGMHTRGSLAIITSLLTALLVASCSSPPSVAPSHLDGLLPVGQVTLTPFQPQAAEATPVCPGEEVLGIGASISAKFDVSYEQVMVWYCAGNEFEDILLALQTHKSSPVEVPVLLALRQKGLSWETIWAEIGLVE